MVSIEGLGTPKSPICLHIWSTQIVNVFYSHKHSYLFSYLFPTICIHRQYFNAPDFREECQFVTLPRHVQVTLDFGEPSLSLTFFFFNFSNLNNDKTPWPSPKKKQSLKKYLNSIVEFVLPCKLARITFSQTPVGAREQRR